MMLCLSVLLFSACSTSKDKWLNRQYHSITAHYNAWWNGNQSLEEGVKSLEKAHKDDFTKILPVYKLGTTANANSIKSNTDRAIEKASKVIKKHSMKFSGVEKNPQIDDAYLLIGKACFYAKDYKSAEATFSLIMGQYKDKKEMYEPMIWLALTNSKEKKYSECDILLDQVKKKIEEGKAPKKLTNFLYTVYAENALAQGKNALALEYFKKRKFTFFQSKLNTRLLFIEGQIYQEAKEYDIATKCFKKTARRAADYDMQFASNLNIAMCYDPKKSSSKAILSRLNKMAEDKKNIEFKDQVYYALGEVYFRDKNVDKACEQWEESVHLSTTNTQQKIISSLRVADTYFSLLEKYEKAQMYYDTALAVMPKDYPNRANIESRQKVLTNLVEDLRCVERWDSLIALSMLSQEELDRRINSYIEEYKRIQKEKEEEKKKAQALAASMAGMTRYDQFNQNQSNWYFYNNATVQVGQLEFKRIWGDRPLEDNWRLSHKDDEFNFDEMAEMFDEEGNPIESDSTANNKKKATNPETKEYYTKDIPFTKEQKDVANEEIADALLSAGYIYYQGLQNTGKAIETFLELHRRFASHQNILPSSYHLYRIYDEIGQYPNSNFYKNKFLTEYPESEFALMISNPEYWQEVSKAGSLGEILYSNVYKVYQKDLYEQTLLESEKARDSLKIGPYIPKLLYVEALAKGRLYGIDKISLSVVLYSVIKVCDLQIIVVSSSIMLHIITEGSIFRDLAFSNSTLIPNKKIIFLKVQIFFFPGSDPTSDREDIDDRVLFHTALNLSSEAPPGEIREFHIRFEKDLKSLISELLLCRQGE
ncbi:MAG: hypothetical protein J6P97_05745, partial [Bacteroidales bacterium]|nr:hypothetical protein [Bacteroidales bacterium]